MSDRSAADTTRTAPSSSSTIGRLRPLLFMAPLWFVATFYFRGDLGKWADDWGFHGRDPVTGAARWWSIMRPGYYGFWRPLHIRSAAGLQTLLWHHDWAIHLILAAIHGVNVWLLWRVLCRGGLSRQASLAGAVALLVWPAGYEAVFWLSTIGTTVGLAALLLCLLAAQRLATGELSRGGVLLHIPILLTVGWWYEQPAVAAPVIALAYLALAQVDRPRRQRLLIAASLGAAACAAVLVYAAIFLALAGPGQRGGSHTLIDARTAWPHIQMILRQTREHLLLVDFLAAAIAQGWKAIVSMRTQALVLGVLLLVGTFIMGSWWMRAGSADDADDESPRQPSKAIRRGALVLIGLGVAAASLLPVMLVTKQWFSSRLSYIPTAGLIIAGAALLDVVIGSHIGQSRRLAGILVRGGVLAATLVLAGVGASALVGVQSAWHARAARDARFIRQLPQVVPNPPRNAVFVPVTVQDRLFNTGCTRFDFFQFGPMEMTWSATIVRHIYNRADLHGLAYHRWANASRRIAGVRGGTADGLVIAESAGPFAAERRFDDRHVIIPWDRVVPLQIGPRGGLSVARVLELDHPELSPLRIQVAAAPRAPRAAAGEAPASTMRLPRVLPESTTIYRPTWHLASGAPAEVTPQQALGQSHPAIRLHPAIGTLTGFDVIEAELPAADTPRIASWRLAMPDHLWSDRPPLTDGIGVMVTIDGQIAPLLQRQIGPEELAESRRWIAMSAQLPPTASSLRVRISVNAGAGGSGDYDWCIVTPPVVIDPAPADAAGSADSTGGP